jgi:hypothetical protein
MDFTGLRVRAAQHLSFCNWPPLKVSLNIAQRDVGMITLYCWYAGCAKLSLHVIGVSKKWQRRTNPVKRQHPNFLPLSSWLQNAMISTATLAQRS